MSTKPIFKKPFGGSDALWHNQNMGTTRSVLCEICGTSHPELPDGADSYYLSQFLGRQMIDECCGGVLDVIFEESGRTFALAYIKQCAEDPTSSQFSELLFMINEGLSRAKKILEKSSKNLKATQKLSEEIVVRLPKK